MLADVDKAHTEKECIRVILADYYARLRASPDLALHLQEARKDNELFATLEAAAKDYPSPTKAELAWARQLLNPAPSWPEETMNPAALQLIAGKPSLSLVSRIVFFAGLISIPGFVLSFLLRGSLLFLFSGIALQTPKGDRASGLRCLLRAAVASSPFLLSVLILKLVDPNLSLLYAGGNLLFPILPLVLTAAAVIYSAFRPERGIPDLIAGTYLVVR